MRRIDVAPDLTLFQADARHALPHIPSNSITLCVTSPPYNVGIEYGEHDDRMPFAEYLEMLRAVWLECYRTLIPGGRLAINVAGVGRSPYLPLHSYITQQLLEIGFMDRGEIIWDKSQSVGSSTAWGSWCSPANPSLRDEHEYILVWSKGDWSLPHKGESDLTAEEFPTYTRSIWRVPTENAKRRGHPAPFPLELPARLIKLYTYRGDTILDPFAGSGTTLEAAIQLGRRALGIEMDPDHIVTTLQHLRRAQPGFALGGGSPDHGT